MRLPNTRVVLIAAPIIAVPVLAFAWWLLSPLFLNTTVSEDFPLSASAAMPEGVTQQEAEEIMVGMAKINMEMVEPMPGSTEPTLLASGKFRDGDSFHKGNGDASLYRLSNGDTLLRFENLSVTNGPALHVVVTSDSNPQGRADLNAAGYDDLGRLKANRGDQNYEVAASIDVDSIGSVVIYCMPFQVIFSVATLEDES